jgi:hypothetical protein
MATDIGNEEALGTSFGSVMIRAGTGLMRKDGDRDLQTRVFVLYISLYGDRHGRQSSSPTHRIRSEENEHWRLSGTDTTSPRFPNTDLVTLQGEDGISPSKQQAKPARRGRRNRG